MLLAWVYLFFAGILEICWAVGLKYTDGFTKLVPSLFTAATLIGSMLLLAKAVQVLPIGTAYAVWVGIGTLGTAVLGILLLNESVSVLKFMFLGLLLISIIGLKYSA